eukprot:s333_g4.t1
MWRIRSVLRPAVRATAAAALASSWANPPLRGPCDCDGSSWDRHRRMATPLDLRLGLTKPEDTAFRLRWGILGCGPISSDWCKCLKEVPGAVLQSCAARDAEKAAKRHSPSTGRLFWLKKAAGLWVKFWVDDGIADRSFLGEPEKEAEAYDLAYQTALSQTGGAEAPPGFVLRGEASPGTLEMGGGSGIGEADLPTANPFHSERVRSEVQLIRSRPQTLDADGRRLRGEVDESGLGDLAGPPLTAEPDYSIGIGGGPATEEAPRVARIEPATDVGSPSGVRGATPCVIDLTEATPRETKQSTSGGESTRLLSGPPGVGKEDDPEVQEEDTRELIPADTDRLTRVEMLLGQVLEENRALKRQLQAESHSSYHSTRTPQEVRQIFQGLSPSADIWFASVEQAATQGYQRWLVADPLGRLAIDPSMIVANFDAHRFQRVESRAVTLLLAAMPTGVRDDLVMNRWLSSASVLFRVLCTWQPGGSSERAHLLSQLVQPDTCKSYKDTLVTLRKWAQNLQRAREISATIPDPSLLVKGVDQATASVLAMNPMVAFRVSAFRHSSGLDYNPTVQGVAQLVKLIQAECEAASIGAESGADKRARVAAAQAAREAPPPKAVPPPPAPPAPSVAAVSAGTGGGKDKGKGKGKSEEGIPPCFKFADASGCKYGDSCHFKHDRAKARRESRCLACGQAGHYRPDCPLVPEEHRQTQSEVGSPSGGSPKGPPAGKGGKAKAKAKAGSQAQAKGVVEETGSVGDSPQGSSATVASASAAGSQDSLLAEAAKLLKNVTIKALRARDPVECGVGGDDVWVDGAWLLSA